MATDRATSMSVEVLVWAREEAGLSQRQLGELISQDESTIANWENGASHPTVSQLDRIAKIVKRPLAVFFFPKPPRMESSRREFRMLPDSPDPRELRDTLFAIREAQARQLSILELCEGQNPAGENFILAKSAITNAPGIREHIGITLSAQTGWKSAQVAFKAWRQAVETSGVIVFKRHFKQVSVSGFCVFHPIVPVIVINNGTTWTRQIFTLAHELGHLVLQKTHGVTHADEAGKSAMTHSEQEAENACNRFASELLLPHTVDKDLPGNTAKANIEQFAAGYHVSPEVVLRRLLDLRRIASDTYKKWASEWSASFYARKQNIDSDRTGGDYYATQASYLGPSFLMLAYRARLQGKITEAELAEHLGIKAKNLPGLERYVIS